MFLEKYFLYHPNRDAVGEPPGEDVVLTAADGVRSHAWYVTHPEATISILYLHGNAGNIDDRRDYIEFLRRIPANILALDYRGYGGNTGKPTEAGLYADANAAYDWLAARVPAERIVVLGESLGGGPACEIALTRPVASLILHATFTNIADMSRRVVPVLPVRWLVSTRYDNLAKISSIRCPKMFFHCRDDEVVPFSHGERLFAAAAEPKEKAWFDQGGHNGMLKVNGQAYLDAIRRFCQRV